MFGQNKNIPFIFNTPPRQVSQPYPWAPPPNFSPTKAFPAAVQEEPVDVDMAEVSPPKPEERENVPESRMVATGGMRRILQSRLRNGTTRARSRGRENWDDDGSDSDEDNEGQMASVTQNTNHYTLNLPSPSPPQSDMPYILLGSVQFLFLHYLKSSIMNSSRYLQVFFNLSLILVFLYLVLQFIITVQRDVEQRISEYSMGMYRSHMSFDVC